MNDMQIVAILIGILSGLLCGGVVVFVIECVKSIYLQILINGFVYAVVIGVTSSLLPDYTILVRSVLVLVALLTTSIGGYVVGRLNRNKRN